MLKNIQKMANLGRAIILKMNFVKIMGQHSDLFRLFRVDLSAVSGNSCPWTGYAGLSSSTRCRSHGGSSHTFRRWNCTENIKEHILKKGAFYIFDFQVEIDSSQIGAKNIKFFLSFKNVKFEELWVINGLETNAL